MASSQVRTGARITVRDEGLLRELLTRPLDFGCMPGPSRTESGGFLVMAIGDEAELRALAGDGVEVVVDAVGEVAAEVGVGDRFDGGRVVPRGFGVKAPASGDGGAGR
ncbi:hypothetical protein AB0L63_31970 [Nocardia sp. NPDC051990]|uniref:hypothetical protein n=1 Tax=Nocardia sp. NPDC051990 TaxID=3155285 RepID=UPI00341D9196